MTNSEMLIGLALQGALQIQQYQLALQKAAAENRDVTNEERDAAIAAAQAAVNNLAAS